MNIRYLQGRAPELPHRLNFLNGNKLDLLQWLRVLPDQRYVARAQWKGRTVLAKMFVGSRAQRHFQRELTGAQNLADSGLPTPKLLASDYDHAFGGWLLFEYLDDAESLEQRWQQVAHLPLWQQNSAMFYRMPWAVSRGCTSRGCGRATCIWTIFCCIRASCM